MERHDEVTGDYGYDLAHELAHEEVGPVQALDETTGPAHGGAPPVSGKDDLAADVSYDEAHDF